MMNLVWPAVNPAPNTRRTAVTVFVVNYDLRKPGQNYQPLWDRLAAWKAVRGLESMWFITATTTADELRDDLRGYVDSSDGIFVAELVGRCAWFNLKGNTGQHLLTQFARAA
jgi:hypothetical protein